MPAMTADAKAFGFSDAARRISDAVHQAIVDGHRDRWMAFDLGTGESNKQTYDTKGDAIRHHANKAREFCYLRVPWDQCTPRSAEVFLAVHRQLKRLGQHPDDEMINKDFMLPNVREAYPTLDRRRILTIDRRMPAGARYSPGGLILP